jgi:hypothetical protein
VEDGAGVLALQVQNDLKSRSSWLAGGRPAATFSGCLSGVTLRCCPARAPSPALGPDLVLLHDVWVLQGVLEPQLQLGGKAVQGRQRAAGQQQAAHAARQQAVQRHAWVWVRGG